MADLKISQFVDGGSVQETDEIATNRGGLNTKVFVGSAASLNVGSDPGDISINSQFGSAARLNVGSDPFTIPLFEDDGSGNPQYPSGDGSLITGIVESGEVKVISTDTDSGFLEDKITVGVGLTKETVTPTGDADLNLDVRHLVNVVTASTGTVTLDIADGDFHVVTVTGVITLDFSMENAQAVIIRGIGFDDFAPVSSLDWGSSGEPAWTGKDDFVVYRDNDGDYKASLVASGLT